jgi:plastocyanin
MALPVVVLAAPPASATMRFGSPNHGSGCNFPCVDDASFHSVDQVVPGAVAISAGGTVTFDVEGFHQVAIYAAGTRVADIEPNPGAFPFVDDPEGRIFLGGLTADATFTFEEPGKYLVICEIAPHFEGAQMWAWVQVK